MTVRCPVVTIGFQNLYDRSCSASLIMRFPTRKTGSSLKRN